MRECEDAGTVRVAAVPHLRILHLCITRREGLIAGPLGPAAPATDPMLIGRLSALGALPVTMLPQVLSLMQRRAQSHWTIAGQQQRGIPGQLLMNLRHALG